MKLSRGVYTIWREGKFKLESLQSPISMKLLTLHNNVFLLFEMYLFYNYVDFFLYVLMYCFGLLGEEVKKEFWVSGRKFILIGTLKKLLLDIPISFLKRKGNF